MFYMLTDLMMISLFLIVIQSSGQSVSSTGDWWPGAEVDVVSGHDIGVVYVERGSDMFGVGLCLSHPGHDRNKKVSEEVDHKDRYQLKHDSPVYWLRQQQWWAHQTNTLMLPAPIYDDKF